MKIMHGDLSPRKSSDNRNPKTSGINNQSRKSAKTSSDDLAGSLSGGTVNIRQQMIQVQRLLSRSQAVLGGLQGFQIFLDSGNSNRHQEALKYLPGVVYDGEPVLEPYREQLMKLLPKKNNADLNRLIEEVQTDIKAFSSTLNRYETVAQNARALITGIKDVEEIPFSIKRENVLNLLL